MNNINEWTQVYLNNGIPRDPGKNNLKEIVCSLNNGRQPNVIYSILRGMGITEELANFAISNYLTEPSKEMLASYSVTGTKNNIKTIMTENFNLTGLLEYVKELKENVISLVQEDNTSINYSAKQVIDICEAYETNIGNILVLLEELESVKGDSIKETRLKFRLDENELMGLSQYKHLSSFITNISKFNYLKPVADFVSETSSILENDKYMVLTANCLYNMSNDKNSAYYEAAASDLKYLIGKGEDGIKSKLKIVMEKHNWINHVAGMINDHAIYEQALVSTGEGTIKRVYSPLQINEDKSIIFTLDGKYFNLKEAEITEVEDLTIIESSFFNTQRALANFKIVGENLILFNKDSSLEINPETKEIKVDDKVIESDVTSLRNYLISTNFFNVNEMYKIDELMYLLEGIDTLSELDFVTSITSNNKEGVTVNIIRVDEANIFINRINPTMKVNELFKVVDVDEAQSKVNEFINFDISTKVVEMLDAGAQDKIKLEEDKGALVDKLNYLQEKRNELEKTLLLVGNSDEITEALILIKNEIKDKEVDLQEVYLKLGKPVSEGKKLEDKGYIEAEIVNKNGAFKPGDMIYVYAEDYTAKGDKEEIKMMKDEKSKPTYIAKKDVKIK